MRLLRQAPRGCPPWGGAAHPEPRRRVERMRDIISPTIPSPLFSLSSRGSARDLGLAHSHVYLLYSPTPSPNVTSAHCPTPTPPVYNVPCRSSSFPPSTSPAPLPRDGRQNFLPDQSNRHGFCVNQSEAIKGSHLDSPQGPPLQAKPCALDTDVA